MHLLFMILYLLAGICFGLAAGRVTHKVDYLALGLMFWVLATMIQTPRVL